jgi:glycine betaine/proline transport system substrate-binding protein
MKSYTWIAIAAVVLVGVLAFVVPGMLRDREDTQLPDNGQQIENGEEPEAESVELVFVPWACATASSHLVKNVLETRLENVTVELNRTEAGFMWQSVATGDTDFMVAAWLPGTHALYFEEFEDSLVTVRANYEGAQIGLIVPQYVTIDSIAELNDFADEFQGRIVGIDAGAGIMLATNDAIEVYDLDYELQSSSEAAMIAELSTSIDNEEWVVVTGWAPHWKLAEWELKFLEDPENVYGGEENIYTITRENFADDNPRVQAFLERYFLTPEQLGNLMGMVEEMGDADEVALQWIEDNSDIVDEWVAGIE